MLALLLPVLLAAAAALPAQPDNRKSVTIAVYYEALCPDSINFVNEQLFPAWRTFGADITIQFKPFGKANWTESGSSYDFTCQHGPDECLGNKAQACVLDQVTEPKAYVPMIDCLMRTHARPEPAVGPCVAELGVQVAPETVLACAAGDKGSELLHLLGEETHGLDPPLHFVPWILFNGEFIEADWQAALTDLHSVLCNNYLAGHAACK